MTLTQAVNPPLLIEPSPTPTSGALDAQQRVGWQPSRFLSARAEAERAIPLAERLGSVRVGRNALVGWAVLFEG